MQPALLPLVTSCGMSWAKAGSPFSIQDCIILLNCKDRLSNTCFGHLHTSRALVVLFSVPETFCTFPPDPTGLTPYPSSSLRHCLLQEFLPYPPHPATPPSISSSSSLDHLHPHTNILYSLLVNVLQTCATRW